MIFLTKWLKIQIEHQYKNKNSEHSRCIRRHLHIVVTLGGAGSKMIQKYADVCRFFSELPGKLADINALGFFLVNMTDGHSVQSFLAHR